MSEFILYAVDEPRAEPTYIRVGEHADLAGEVERALELDHGLGAVEAYDLAQLLSDSYDAPTVRWTQEGRGFRLVKNE